MKGRVVVNRYITPITDVATESIVWSDMPSGRSVTRTPLVDRATGLFARLTYRDLLAVASSLNVSIISAEGVKDVKAYGFRIDPVILPSADMRPPRLPGETLAAYEGRIRIPMGSIDWARIHDLRARQKLADWDLRPVLNMGKWWVAGAPSGRSWLMGWHDGKRWIQPQPAIGSRGPHNDQHTDYGTLSMLERGAR